MPFYVYILYSKSRDRFYVGQTKDVGDRFIRHNTGKSKSTRSGRPWRLVYAEKHPSRSEAMTREKQIKAMKDRSLI